MICDRESINTRVKQCNPQKVRQVTELSGYNYTAAYTSRNSGMSTSSVYINAKKIYGKRVPRADEYLLFNKISRTRNNLG